MVSSPRKRFLQRCLSWGAGCACLHLLAVAPPPHPPRSVLPPPQLGQATVRADQFPWIFAGIATLGAGALMAAFLRHRVRQLRDVTEELRGELELVRSDSERSLRARTVELEKANAQLHQEATERIEAKNALADRESRLNEAQSIAQVGSFHWDTRSQKLEWSDQLHRIYGQDPARFTPSFDAYIGSIHAEDQGRVLSRIQAAMQQGLDFNHDYRIVRPNGEIRWVTAIVRIEKSAGGEVLGLSGTCQDITERKLADEAREEESLWRRTLLQSSMDGIVVLDERGGVLEANTRMCQMLGYTLEELLRLNVHAWDSPNLPDSWTSYLEAETSTTLPFETECRNKDGNLIPVEVSLSRLQWRSRRFVLAICRDISERRSDEGILTAQAAVLERIARGAPLDETLDQLLRAVDDHGGGIRSSILLLDEAGEKLSTAAAPNLPVAYSRALQNIPIGPKVGSCGTAAFTGRPVYVQDIDSDPLWEDFRHLPQPHGLRACWSTPIQDTEQRVLGTLAIYAPKPSLPTAKHQRLIEAATHTAAICIGRSRDESALRLSEATLKSAQAMAHVGSWVYDVERKLFHGSEEARSLCHWEARPHTAEELWRLIHPEDHERTRAAWGDALAGNAYEIEHRLIVNNRLIWVHARAHVERDALGRVVRIVGMTQDITDRKRLEIALRAVSAASTLENHSNVYKHLCDQLGQVFESTCAVIAEHRRTEPNDWLIRGSSGHGEPLQACVLKHLKALGNFAALQPHPAYCEELQPDPSIGLTTPMSCLAIPLHDSAGRFLGLIAVLHPVSIGLPADSMPMLRLFAERAAAEMERNRSLEALQSAEARFRSVIENSRDGLLLLDADGCCSYASPAIRRILGVPESELVGQTLNRFISPEHLECYQRHRLAVQQSNESNNAVEIEVQRQDGMLRWVLLTETNHLSDPSLRAIVSSWQDITEQKQSATAQERLERQLRQSQKMEAIGTLAGGIAHDFNNILGAITGYAELALLQCDTSPGVEADLREILKSGFRAKDLVRQILTFSRQQEPKRGRLDLGRVLADSMRLLRAGIPANIELQSVIHDHLPPVLADVTQIQQVLLNLVSNASAAIGPCPGRVTLELASVDPESNETRRHRDFPPGPAIRLSVRDTGPGIEPTILDRIFEPFFTTKGPGQGTGLGLSVVHGIVRSHEGMIEVQSEPKQGTCFHIYFPACPLEEPDPRGDRAESPTPALPPAQELRGRVLVVDDELSLLTVTSKILRHHGLEVTTASRPSEALELFQQADSTFDLIITDYAMPGCNGVDFGLQILGLKPSMPILLCSGHGAGMNRERAIEYGFREFLTKPVGMEALLDAVKSVLGPNSETARQNGPQPH